MSRTATHRAAQPRLLFRLFFLLLIGASIQSAQAQISLPLPLGCVWPFKTTPQTLNVFYPDSNAIYWTTPFILLPGSSLEIDGSFFPARFISIATYNTLGESLSSTYDKQFVLNSGSQNPYLDSGASGGSFHATILPSPSAVPPPPSGDVIYGPRINQYGFSQGYVVIRSYLGGDVQQSALPKITVSLGGHKIATLSPCATLQPSIRLLIFNALIRAWDGNYNAPGATEPDALMFRPPSSDQANGAFPNDYNKYIVTGMTYQKGQIAVVRGLAATVPANGQYDYPVQGGNMRYWSLCNNDHIFPFPVVKDGCAADSQTHLDADGYYTYVIAAKKDIPANATTDSTVTLLPWGVTQVEKALIFRNMLPDTSFTMTTQTANIKCMNSSIDQSATCTANVMGPYYPTATYCDKTVYEQGGWKACFQTPAVR